MKQWLAENRNGGGVLYKCPLIIAQGSSGVGQNNTVETTEHLYLWLFGSVHELPWQFNYVDQMDEENSFNDILKRRLLGR